LQPPPPEWMMYFFQTFGYFGVFFVSLLGTASIIIPIPYTLFILWLGIAGFDPILLTIAGGLGSAFGELSGYLLGYYGRRIISSERQKKLSYLVQLIDRYGPVAVFIFALTPLPDDLLFIPLGILRFNFLKVFIPAILGKLLMCFILAYFGKTYGQFIFLIFGEGSWIAMGITAVALIIIIVILYRIDWEKVFEKYAAKRGEKQS